MSLWVIENLDDAGEGMFVCEAPNKKTALQMHDKKNKGLQILDCQRVKWIDLALITGKLGESYYFERQRKTRP